MMQEDYETLEYLRSKYRYRVKAQVVLYWLIAVLSLLLQIGFLVTFIVLVVYIQSLEVQPILDSLRNVDVGALNEALRVFSKIDFESLSRLQDIDYAALAKIDFKKIQSLLNLLNKLKFS